MEVKPVEEASVAADAAAAEQQKYQADFAAVVKSGGAAHSAASEHLEGDPVSAAVMSGPGIGYAAAGEPHSSVGEPVGGPSPGLLVDLSFAEAVVSVGGPCSASAQFQPQAEKGIGGYEQAEEDLKCYEQHTTHYAGS